MRIRCATLSQPPERAASLMTVADADPVEAFRQWDQTQSTFGPHNQPKYAARVFSGMSEKQFIALFLPKLKELFDVKRECWGTCLPFSQVQSKRVRVDLICQPKQGVGWGLGAFAVECKRPDRPATVRLGDHIAQAMDYRSTYFDGLGYLPVFLCPGLQGYANPDPGEINAYRESNSCIHYESARRVLGGFGLGEMFIAKDGNFSLFMAAEPLIVRGRITGNGAKQKKIGRGVGSSST